MTLTLRIENFDVLEHGGPTSITLNQKGADVGRGSSMDWILPDPQRHISSRHFTIAYRNGDYFLTDTSTNGTFIDGTTHRIQGDHKIRSGDRFTVGHYLVVAEIVNAAPVQSPPSQTQGPSALQTPPTSTSSSAPVSMPPTAGDDPWDFGTPSEPVNPLPPAGGQRLDEVAGDFVPQAVPMPNPGTTSMPPQNFQQSPFQQPQAPPPAAVPGGDAILAAFCQGAGLNPADYPDVDVQKLAHDLGQVIQSSAREIMTMLQDRAAVKQFTKGGERTMRSATGNNPMKFLPDSTQAIETMFLKPRDGFMKGTDGYENALRDIRRHQSAVFAALQPALASLLSGLSPDEIEDNVGAGILGGGSKGKFWDAYVERWDAKAEAGENGLLDAFLTAFAKSYASAAGKADE